MVKGYKVFNSDWTCRGFKYTCPGVFEEDVIPIPCKSGFHFCQKASDCFDYYSFNPNNKVAEVIALGEVADEGNKSCTNKIQIVREIPWSELLEIVNTGKGCSGLCNSGDWNSGNCNSGNWNSGDCNSGDWNSGDCNSGNWNSGDWNKTNFSNGCFNTEEPKVFLFNKPSDMTFREWRNSGAYYALSTMPVPIKVLEWVYLSSMTDDEKKNHPEAETVGGYLKVLTKEESSQTWWDGLSDYKKDIIKAIPNFDPEIFREITGINAEV